MGQGVDISIVVGGGQVGGKTTGQGVVVSQVGGGVQVGGGGHVMVG